MKVKDLWANCPVFMTIKSGKHTFSYKFYVEAWDPSTKLFTVTGQQEPLKGFTEGIVKVEPGSLSTFKRWTVSEVWFAKISALPSSLSDEADIRAELVELHKKWRLKKKEVHNG